MSVNVEPFFLDNNGRRIFCLSYQKLRRQDRSKAILVLPAFAEEMNCTRRLTHNLSHQLASAGYHVMSPDLSHTGDSAGEFNGARFANWLEDLRNSSNWLLENATTLNLLAFRGGSLFLPEMTSMLARNQSKVCLIQPLDTGEQWLAEFLRLRVAKSMFEGEKETVDSLKDLLRQGQTIEVAGYELNPELCSELIKQDLTKSAFGTSEQGLVISCQRSPDEVRVQKLNALIANWQCPKNSFRSVMIKGDAFWSNDQSIYPAKIEETVLTYFK